MYAYFIRRILLFIPTFIVVSLIAFGLSKAVPGDPVEEVITGLGSTEAKMKDLEREKRNYETAAQRLGLDKPAFYFNFTTAAQPDTLYKILYQPRRKALKNLTAQYGNWSNVQTYYHSIEGFEQAILQTKDYSNDQQLIKVRNRTLELYELYQPNLIAQKLRQIERLLDHTYVLHRQLEPHFQGLQDNFVAIQANPRTWLLYVPAIHWYGTNNQYHTWISRFFKGDFGYSYRDSRPISGKVLRALKWTLIINSIAVFLAFLIAIPLGVYSAVYQNSIFDKVVSGGLFFLFSLPTFWAGTLLLIFCTTPEYSRWLHFFPSPSGISTTFNGEQSVWQQAWSQSQFLVLPIICLTYSSLTFLARQVRGSMIEVLPMTYIKTARAKGLSTQTVIWKHAFRNALFPIITIFGTLLPALIGGSVILEKIFLIPGMGRLVFQSILSQDWPVVHAVLLLGTVITMLGILIADLLYAFADPRVKLTEQV